MRRQRGSGQRGAAQGTAVLPLRRWPVPLACSAPLACPSGEEAAGQRCTRRGVLAAGAAPSGPGWGRLLLVLWCRSASRALHVSRAQTQAPARKKSASA